MMKKTFIAKRINFLADQRGAVAIMYAIMLPALLGFAAIAIDGSSALVARARLADAVNEAALAIATTNNLNKTQKDNADNLAMATRYINYYVGRGNQEPPKVSVRVDDQRDNADNPHIDYLIDASVSLNVMLPLEAITGVGDRLTISNYNNNSGNVRRSLDLQPADVVFVVDFSGSSNCPIDEPICNQWLADSGRTKRLDMLKEVVSNIVTEHKDSEMQFAVVPFDIGVPFRQEDSVKESLDNISERNFNDAFSRNEQEEILGCSVLYAPNSLYEGIDYDFWADKNIPFLTEPTYYSKTTSGNGNIDRINYAIDYERYVYFRYLFSAFQGYGNFWWYIKGNLGSPLGDNTPCVNNGFAVDNPMNGKYFISCERDPTRSIFTEKNQNKIIEQYKIVAMLLRTMYTESLDNVENYSFANIHTVDVDKTLKNLFDPKLIREFVQPWAPHRYGQRAFSMMCQSAQYGVVTIPGQQNVKPFTLLLDMINRSYGDSIKYRKTYLKTHLIPMTTTTKEKEVLLNNFLAMTPGGGTDSLSGLLRSAQVAMSGDNKRKVIIMISDGQDDEGPKKLAEKFHEQGKVCDVIRNGLKDASIVGEEHKADSVSIHFISINDNTKNVTQQMDYWQQHCANGDAQYVHLANDQDLLLRKMNDILSKSETGNFIRDK